MEAQKPKKILVVDDNSDWRKTFIGMLRDAHFEAVAVGTVDEARAQLAAGKYALVLLDMRLVESDESNVDGLILAEEIQEYWPQVKAVIVTGYDTPETVNRAMQPRWGRLKPAADFITKNDVNGLIDIVQKLIA